VNGPFLRRDGEGVALAGPAVGLVETTSIARGLVVADAMVKKAPVELAFARPVTPGKHVVIVTGEVAEVEEAMLVGEKVAAPTLVDRLFLPRAHPALLRALAGGRRAPGLAAIGIVETFSVAATLLGADAACKAAEVELAELRLADGLGGKAYFVVTQVLDLVEAAIGAAVRILEPGLLVTTEIIAAPHPDLAEALRRAQSAPRG
jgi:microcompartment protein CcmL/EutN